MSKQTFCDGFTRRDALQLGLAGLTGLSLPGLLERLTHAAHAKRKPTADAVLFVNLAGGPSHLDTLDMKPTASAETRGPFQSIGTKIAGLKICEHLPKLAAAIDRFTLLRGISHTAGSHPQGQSYIATGNRPSPALIYPSYGSIVTREKPGRPDLPGYVAIPQTEWNAGYLGDAFAPFKTNAVPRPGQPFSVRGVTLAPGLTSEKVVRREKLLRDLDRSFAESDSSSLLDALDTFGKQAHSMIMSAWTKKAFDVAAEKESLRKRFAADELGQSLLLGVRLIEHGVRFVTVTNAGWDTHLDNFRGHQRLMKPFDAALPATLDALQAKGLLDRTLVVVMGEFGRTPKVNANRGRDHYPRANWCALAGGGVQTGQLIGGTDSAGAAPDDGTDIHPDDIGATIFAALGIDPQKEYHTPAGQPVRLIPQGRVLDQVFRGQ